MKPVQFWKKRQLKLYIFQTASPFWTKCIASPNVKNLALENGQAVGYMLF